MFFYSCLSEEEEEEEEDFCMLFVMKTLKNERYIVIKAYKFRVLRFCEIFFVLPILCVCTIPTYGVYQLYDKWHGMEQLQPVCLKPMKCSLPETRLSM